jgi:flagellar basal-body rod protein FlgF
MRGNMYVSLSGELALEKRLDTVATNLANVNTGGYRAQGVSFASLVSKAGERPAAFVTTGADYISRAQGAAQQTGNPFDVAIQGDSWFAIKTPDGTAFTRDGRFQMSESGQLQTINGYPVLDAGGASMLLAADGGAPKIASDGMITQGGNQIGAIGLFTLPEDATLSRYDNSAVVPSKPGIPVLDFAKNTVAQGFAEGSNVNPVLEITKMIQIQRAFDGLINLQQTAESSQQDAIKTLGSNS